MFDDFCSECEFRQNPLNQSVGPSGCGSQFTPMQGPWGMPLMQMPGGMGSVPGSMGTMPGGMVPMQGTTAPPMPGGQQGQGNIFQPTPTQPPMGPTSQTSGTLPQPGTGMMNQPTGPSPVPGETFSEAPGAPVYQDTRYMQGYLRTLIGKYVSIEFLIGTNQLVDREGILLDVGISYAVLREAQTDDQVMCDIFSIKFVTAYY